MYFCNYLYAARFLMEIDTNKLVHRIDLHPNGLPGAQVACSILQIWLFYLDMIDSLGRINPCSDGLLQQLWGEWEHEHNDADDLEETMELSLWETLVEQWLKTMTKGRAYEPFDRLRLMDEYKFDIERGWWLSEELEVARWKNTIGNAAIAAGRCEMPCFRWSIPLEVATQPTASNDVGKPRQ